MANDKEQAQREELSRCLDVLAGGGRVTSTDAAVREWVDTAAYVKAVFTPPDVPDTKALAAAVAARLMARQRQRRRFWLFSGAAGTVAAVVAALALHLTTIAPGGEWAVQNAPAAPSAPANTTAESPTEPAAPPTTVKQDTASQPTHHVDAASPAPAASAPRALENVAEEDAAADRGAPAASPSAASSRAIAFLSLPGRNADAVSVDRASGVIRQVYNLGAAGPVTITQRPHAAGPQVALRSFAAQEGLNRITVTVDGMDVTVEGRLPAAELQKIAAALVVRQVQQ